MCLHQLLCVLGLIVELSGQLMILQDCKSRLCLQLLVIECHEVGLGLLDLEVHLLRQLLNILNLFKLFLVNLNHARLLLVLELLLQSCDLVLHIILRLLVLLSRE